MTTIKLEPKLTPANKKLITNDWSAGFPQFKVCGPLWLLRRTGPLVVGVCLDYTPGGSDYVPTFHMHCLAKPFDAITFTLGHRLKTIRSGTTESIKVRFHYDHVDEAIARLKDQVKFPMCGTWNLGDVVAAYHSYMLTPYGRYPALLYEDLFSLYTWCGKQEKALRILDEYMPTVRAWEQVVIDAYGEPDAWYAKCRKIIEDTDVHQIVEDEVIKHKLTKIPDEGFDCTD